jgi:hypothetical protein
MFIFMHNFFNSAFELFAIFVELTSLKSFKMNGMGRGCSAQFSLPAAVLTILAGSFQVI